MLIQKTLVTENKVLTWHQQSDSASVTLSFVQDGTTLIFYGRIITLGICKQNFFISFIDGIDVLEHGFEVPENMIY